MAPNLKIIFVTGYLGLSNAGFLHWITDISAGRLLHSPFLKRWANRNHFVYLAMRQRIKFVPVPSQGESEGHTEYGHSSPGEDWVEEEIELRSRHFGKYEITT